MATQKHDWIKWKIEYLQSDSIEIKGFFRDVLGVEESFFNANFDAKTSGWRDEKEQLLNEKVEEAKEAIKDEYEVDVRQLNELKQKAINNIVKILNNEPNMRDTKLAWEIVKVELNEPTSVSENRNKNEDSTNMDKFLDILHSAVKKGNKAKE